jgi:hypothetical protein
MCSIFYVIRCKKLLEFEEIEGDLDPISLFLYNIKLLFILKILMNKKNYLFNILTKPKATIIHDKWCYFGWSYTQSN